MKLTSKELVSIIQAHRADSLGVEDGELTNERAEALRRYHGRPYGNEMEGRSAIVSRDLSEAVDWAMPAIMRIFTQSGSVAEFDPVSEEDEQQAEIETDYVNQVIMKDNAGWLVLHDAIKDTLLLKNGYVKHWWEETEKIEEPKYKGLVIEEVQKLMQDLQADEAKVEITGQEERQVMGLQGPISVYDIELKITRKLGKVVLEAVPTEEIRVSRKCRGSLQDSPFVEHVTRKTRSDLIELGMDRAFVDNLPAYADNITSTQRTSRDSVSDETSEYGHAFNDRSMDEIEYCEAYIKVDWDGDGVAELRRVVTVGNEIPDGDEWNEPIPEVAITGFVAKRVPHRHVGESLYDDLADLQLIKTTLLRQLLDNVFAANNNQWLVNERVNLSDFMVSLPGGVKRIQGMEPVQSAVEAIQAIPIVQQILPVVDYIDGIKESRTGISKSMTGLDPDSLNDVTKGAFMENMNRASQKVEMITRLIAESGVKEMVMRVHSLLIRYQDKQRVMRMKGKYIPCNPQEWRERTDLTVKVGLGTGNEEDRQRKLMMIAQLQRDMLAPQGMVDAPHAFALFSDLAKTMGFDMPDKYAMSPNSPEFQQKMANPPPNPVVMAEQAKAQAAMQIEQVKSQAAGQIEQLRAQAKLQEVQANLELQASNDARDAERETMKAMHAAQLAEKQLELDRYKTDLDNATKITIAEMSRQTTLDTTTQAIEQRAGERVASDLGPVMEQMAGLGQGMQAIHAHITAPRKPRKVVRDPNTGQAIGIDDGGTFTPVQRGQDGRIEGI